MSFSDAEHYTALFETSRGAVRRCQCCDCIHVHFGNALLVITDASLRDLHEIVAGFDAADDAAFAHWPAGRVAILTGEVGTAFVFTREEIAELHQLLAGAQLILTVDRGAP